MPTNITLRFTYIHGVQVQAGSGTISNLGIPKYGTIFFYNLALWIWCSVPSRINCPRVILFGETFFCKKSFSKKFIVGHNCLSHNVVNMSLSFRMNAFITVDNPTHQYFITLCISPASMQFRLFITVQLRSE